MALRKWFSPSNLMRRSKAAADWGALPKPNENGHRIPSGRCGLILSEILMLLEWMWPTVGHFWILNITIPPILWFGVFLICCFFHRASCDGPIHRCHPISRKTGFSEAKPGYRYVKPGKPGFPDKPYFFPGFSRSRYGICITYIYIYNVCIYIYIYNVYIYIYIRISWGITIWIPSFYHLHSTPSRLISCAYDKI